MQRDYYLFNKIFNQQNVKLKNLFRILYKVGTIWYYIIWNTIVS